MKLNSKGYDLIVKHEGLSLKPYLCPAKIPTIGYGNTYYPNGKRVTLLDEPITKEEAIEMFEEIANRFKKAVLKKVTADLNDNQITAITSFAYNVGMANFIKSTLLKKINENPNDLQIGKEFEKWVFAGGKRLKGLENRRKSEKQLYFKK